jgi:cell shape-determining protein MreC
MILVFEIAFLFVLGIVAIVTLLTVGRPIAIAYSEREKTKHLAIGSEQGHQMLERINNLEEEVQELKRQIHESNQFQAQLIEKRDK